MQILPQNYRSITAGKWAWISGCILLAVFLVAMAIASIYLLTEYQKAQNERTRELKALTKWEELITKYPNYPEVYYNVAYYEARVGDREKAQEYLAKSLRLNPNYTPGITLQKTLRK